MIQSPIFNNLIQETLCESIFLHNISDLYSNCIHRAFNLPLLFFDVNYIFTFYAFCLWKDNKYKEAQITEIETTLESIDSNVFFVVGKKGTGKSAIYRMIEQASLHNGCLVINKDFGEFPFEKLLSLQDDNFAKPNQYQTIWRNVILICSFKLSPVFQMKTTAIIERSKIIKRCI